MKSLSVSAMACQTLPRRKSLKRSVFKLDIHKASYNCDARDFTGRNGARQLALRDGACKKLLFPKWDVKLKHQLSRIYTKLCPLIRSESWTAQERKGKRFGCFSSLMFLHPRCRHSNSCRMSQRSRLGSSIFQTSQQEGSNSAPATCEYSTKPSKALPKNYLCHTGDRNIVGIGHVIGVPSSGPAKQQIFTPN